MFLNLKKFLEKYSIYFIFALIFATRLFFLGKAPAGINQDEAMAGYQALSMNAEGTDLFGYHNPVYFVAWGSGMSVLPSYIMRISFAFIDNKVVALRLPQAIMSCVALVTFYLLMKRFVPRKKAIVALILAAVMPWNFMSGRWAIDCYMLPVFMLLGTYFFVRGMDSGKWWIVSAICWGLSLYCYALSWMAVPGILLFYFLYGIKTGKIKCTKSTIRWGVPSIVILLLLAIPLILFLLVNYGIIPEIRLSWISIPKLPGMRSSEISLKGLLSGTNLSAFLQLLLTQNDKLINNTTLFYGLFYHFSLVFIVLGIILVVKRTITEFRKKEFIAEVLVLIPLVIYFVLALLVDNINANKINGMLWPLTVCMIIGVFAVADKVGHCIGAAMIGLYLMFFLSFGIYYMTDYRELLQAVNWYGLEDAVAFADELDVEHIYVAEDYSYAKVLFASEISAKEYQETVVYEKYPAAWLKVKSFGRYVMELDLDASPDENAAYIIGYDHVDIFENAGFEVEAFGYSLVAYMPE